MLDEPGKPSKPVIEDYSVTSVTLTWIKPENDGGRPLTHYIIEMKDKLSVEWKEVLLTPDTTCQATVDGLKENQIVTFRVRAANKAGFGEPSEPTDTHTVKHRNRKLPNTNLYPEIVILTVVIPMEFTYKYLQ